MKILFFDKQEKTSAGGTGTYCKEVINGLVKRGHIVIPVRFGDKDQNNHPKAIFLPYSLGDKSIYFLPTPKTFTMVKDILEKEKPDVIHLNLGISLLDFYIPKQAHQRKIPVVGILHTGISSNKTLTLENLGSKSLFVSHLSCFSQLDKVLVFSSQIKNFLFSLGLKENKIEVFPNFVDCQKYSPGKSNFKKERNIKFAFLFLGRIDKIKNPDILIECFLKIKPVFGQKLILVGAGTIGSLYSKLLKKYKKYPQIIFTGPISEINRKVDIIRAADVFVLPSSIEGMSFALLETMACGLAPIVSDAGNHEEVVDDAGIVIEHNKLKDQLPITLQVFVKNPDLAKILGKRAREKVAGNYNQEVQINKLIEIYQKTVMERGKEIPKPNLLMKLSTGLGRSFRSWLPV